MIDRSEFAHHLATLDLSHLDRAVALLYYYRQSQEFEERSAGALASDLHEEGFPKANVTRLRDELSRSRYTAKGKQKGTFQLDLRRLSELDAAYSDVLSIRKVKVVGNVIPTEWITGTRPYLEQMVHQINATYEYGLYDACAVLCRRLMESLIIEIYIQEGRQHQIQVNGVFMMLERLVATISADTAITLSRNSPKTMKEIKQLGDTAAHDRTYITPQVDIDDVKARYRQLLQELLVKAGIKKT
ncbi:DUF4145 domain-containing protein [Phragmitibacter flavus]|uniref:DUF4145 domain-containing protein n=1 Tax=Phragmitibacter flavus TaxID=2576071 RepID=A0A5R8K772_9BACT|nr:DUF4145 domain-containing protein [Phragmitibacter flavus]TLD68211.1 DUF4145 domain-containing protein [Phragmitibacter flavus]